MLGSLWSGARSVSRGYVYVIKPHLKVGGRPVVKIGRTTRSPHTRLRELTTALPSGASLSYFAEFPDVKWAEARLHEVLGEQRVTEGGGTEFFYLSVTEAVTIVQTLAYRVSQVEAMAALKRDLESYLDTLGGGIGAKSERAYFLQHGSLFHWSGLRPRAPRWDRVHSTGCGFFGAELLFLFLFLT